jgi:hypothetical protein
MKTAIYACLLLCLSSCRLSQPLPSSEAAAAPAVASATSLAVGTAAIAITNSSPTPPAKQAPSLLCQIAPRKSKTAPLVRYISLSKATKIKRLTIPNSSSVAADRPAITPGKSLILAGLGAIILLTAAFIIPSITSFRGAIIIVPVLALGVTFFLLGFFSYLLGLSEKGRAARATKLKR